MNNVSLLCPGEYFKKCSVFETHLALISFYDFSNIGKSVAFSMSRSLVSACLHSCEIRRSPQPTLWKIPFPQSWQVGAGAGVPASSVPVAVTEDRLVRAALSLPFLKFSTTDVFALLTYTLLFLPLFHRFLQMSAIDLNLGISCPDVLVDDHGM